jgi:ABC-type sugar transport system substrate-binding protein
MKNRMYIIVVVILLTIGFASSAIALELAPDGFPIPRVVKDRPLKIGEIYFDLSVESAIRNYQQGKIEGAHRGWELSQQEGRNDSGCRDIMQSFITKNVDAIIIPNMAMLPIADLIIKAREKGIGVYNVDTQLMPGVIANCTQPNGVAALKLFYKVGEDLLWKGKIAIITVPAIQVNVERTNPIKALIGVYPGLEIVGEEFIDLSIGSFREQAYNFAKRWITKYGDDLDVIVSSWDGGAVGAANAIKASGFDQSQIFSTGIDGGSETWSYIRANSPFKYNFSQPFELYRHDIWELIEQMQVKGMQPGDKGCLISKYGETIYEEGRVVVANTVPELGESVHGLFNFYGGDPDDPDAWYNWQDAGGPYKIGTKVK